ncbi:hypothetical protein BIY29_01285 [Brenneria alni]|uniref:Type III effector n=1 Tax=Brenneria alni TaxID=71656 RepID=A0A421DTA0_9GAMM|nr:type III effector [Brenneria alni]RLM27746.1 hypothetical protein BIY29_01285 [Brenneria alni]
MNPIHDRYFPGGVTVNPLENFSREHVVKLHEAVSAHSLGIGNYEGRHISVNSSTIEHLRLAQDTLRKVKMMLPYGAGNQKSEVIYTGGESWARTRMLRHIPVSNPIDGALNTARHQAGNCSEIADVGYALLARQRINAPILRVADREWDHSYVLIGDPRDHTWGEKDTVIFDPWVRYPAAATLAQALNRNPAANPLFQRARNTAPAPEAQALNYVSHVTTNEVARYLSSQNKPSIGSSLLEDIFRPIESGDDMFAEMCSASGIGDMPDEKIAVRDPSTRYSSGIHNASTVDGIAQTTVSRQYAVQQAWNQSPY